ncbi:MAG TPA: ATP synthase F1 subunit gamma [Clostridiaceae bacterium]|nr:ATP synthase F1 subunit gamma [Clostridiaceae bacterium]
MEQLSDIKKRMKSVRSVQKITKAMELISSVKSRQSKRLYAQAVPFFSHCATTLLNLLVQEPEFQTDLIELREKEKGDVWHVLVFVLTSDKGLAGTYNQDVVEAARHLIKRRDDELLRQGLRPDFEIKVAGRVGRETLQRFGYVIDTEFSYSIDNPDFYDASDLTELILSAYKEHQYDEVYMIYTRMTSPLVRDPIYIRLLPTDVSGLRYIYAALRHNPDVQHVLPEEHFEKDKRLDFLYPQDIDSMIDYLFSTTLSGLVFGALTEAYASEQTARMTSMNNASRNSNELLEDLTKQRNALRQSQITTELNEIVGGAAGIDDNRR